MSPPRASSEAILSRLETFGVRLGLERMRRSLAAFGDPQRRVPTVLVAGTNGKGSTAALLESMARSAGYRTGLYTSPHLEDVRERVRVDGRAISEPRLAAYLERAVALAEGLQDDPPTYFEALTLAAFQHFDDRALDLAVFEVGLGGRLDATNAGEPVLSLITAIALDHEQQLGPTLGSVAREKAGILRSGRPAIAWGGHPEVREALAREAEAIGARLSFASERLEVSTPEARRRQEQHVELRTPEGRYLLELHLPGRHQGSNLALAVLAAEALRELGWHRLDAAAIAAGAAACRWPARLEWIELPGGRRLLLDAAHNPDGIEALASYLEERAEPVDLLFGAFADKRVEGMLPRIAGLAERLVLTTPPGARASDPHAWKGLVGGRRVEVEADATAALERALGPSPGGEDRPLVVCGSLYLVGCVRRQLRERFGVPEPALGAAETDPAASTPVSGAAQASSS